METIHLVQPFDRTRSGLLPRKPVQLESAELALARAEREAEACDGVIAYSMDVDEVGGEYSDPRVLFKAGEVPDLH